jgi:hypothetical protein
MELSECSNNTAKTEATTSSIPIAISLVVFAKSLSIIKLKNMPSKVKSLEF